jgi:hypothetical protein
MTQSPRLPVIAQEDEYPKPYLNAYRSWCFRVMAPDCCMSANGGCRDIRASGDRPMKRFVQFGLLAAIGMTASPSLSAEGYIAQARATLRGATGTGVAGASLKAAGLVAAPIAVVPQTAAIPTAVPGANFASVTQTGTNNLAAISQSGAGNSASIVQNGTGNRAVISQR